MPTSSTVASVDRSEYSAYYDALSTITVFVATVGSDPNSTVTCSLVREDGYGTVATASAPIVSGKATASIDVTAARDADGIFRAVQGKYHVQVKASDSSVPVNTETFRITPGSVQELKDTYLAGIDLLASNVIKPQTQPQVVTGVTIITTATTQRRELVVLTFVVSGATLSWDGGTAVPVATTGRHSYTLVNADESSWVQVSVQGELLPTADKTESIVMDLDYMSDTDLQTIMNRTYGSLQGRIQTKLEPRDLDTENVGSPQYDSTAHTDEYVRPQTYYRVNFNKNWFSIKFPTANILKVWRLDGYFQTSRAFTVAVDQWVVVNGKGGEVEFVPKYGSVLSFQFFGVPFFAYMHVFEHIPSFWHYRLTVGLPDLKNDDDRSRVRECLLRWAAMDILMQAGQASAPGLIGESTARDGVSESRSYAAGKGGRYANQWQVHHDFLFGPDDNGGEVKRLRDKFVGVLMVIL